MSTGYLIGDEGSGNSLGKRFLKSYFNGDFDIEFGGSTWVEGWQGADADGCAAPVAPHDNSNPAGYSFDTDDMGTMTLHGVGAFLGLPKAVNGAELSSPTDAPDSVVYVFDHFAEDSLFVAVDISADQDGTAWWSYYMAREPAPTRVAFWLDAYDVPCDGNPYLAGSFNGWNATEIEMEYDSEYDEYYAEVMLMPGAYEYKFACFNWSSSEDIPAECSDPNDDGYSNRYVEVPDLPEDDWYELPAVSWGECPEPEPCEVLDCDYLQFVGFLGPQQIDSILVELVDGGILDASVADGSGLDSLVENLSMRILSPDGGREAEYMPMFSDPGDSLLIHIVEYSDSVGRNYPDSLFYYFCSNFGWNGKI